MNDKPLIAYIDDDTDMLEMLSSVLRHAGFTVMCTTHHEVFLEYFNLHKVDLAILDGEMPEKTGFQLAEEIRERPDTANLPIIFLSGHKEAGDQLRGFFSGANEYLTKPVETDHLISTIKNVLDLQ